MLLRIQKHMQYIVTKIHKRSDNSTNPHKRLAYFFAYSKQYAIFANGKALRNADLY